MADSKTVSMEVAHRIWCAHREIKVASKMLDEIRETLKTGSLETPRDVFGRSHRNFEMGVPHGEAGHRLFDVSPRLALSVIGAHIAEKQRELTEASIAARVEMDAP